MSILKLRRRGSFDFPILGVAATLDIDEHGECRDASVVLTAVASAPKVVTEADVITAREKSHFGVDRRGRGSGGEDGPSARQCRFGLLVSEDAWRKCIRKELWRRWQA